MCGIAVSSSPTVCGFSPFWFTVFGKRRSFTVLRYHLFALSCLIQVNTMCSTNHSKLNRLIKANIPKTLDLRVNDYTIYDEIGRESNDRAFRPLYRSRGAIHLTKTPPVRPGKVVHLKRWTSFFETFPVGPNRSIEFQTEISGNLG